MLDQMDETIRLTLSQIKAYIEADRIEDAETAARTLSNLLGSRQVVELV